MEKDMGKRAKYQDIIKWIRDKIAAGEYETGDRLPSEHELAAWFSVSRQTARHALVLLEEEGLVTRTRGSGTYLSEEYIPKKEEKTMRIQLILTYIDEYIFPAMIKAVEEIVYSHGYALQVSFTNNQIEKEESLIRTLLRERNVDAVIVEPSKSGIPNPNIPLYRQLWMENKIPVVFVNSWYPGILAPCVCLDDKKAGEIITSHLIQCGHTEIGGIFKLDDGQGHRRYEGYVKAILDAGLKMNSRRVIWYDTEDARYMEEEAQRYLRGIRGCTACVCYNDQIASKLMDICRSHGILIPDHLSVVGVDNSRLAAQSRIALTSAENEVESLGRAAGEMILDMLENGSKPESIAFSPRLVIRSSVKTVYRA